MDHALETAHRIAAAYEVLDGLAFAYGQGSVVAGFTKESGLDLVMVWDRAEPPDSAYRPVEKLNEGAGAALTFHQPGFVVDRFWTGQNGSWPPVRLPVGVSHMTLRDFDGWLRDVRAGRGWERVGFPSPLYAVAGFAYGVVVADVAGRGGAARGELARFPRALVERTRASLAADLAAYDRDLAACIRRHDGLQFHEILTRALRLALVAWFSTEHRYCPHPRWLHQWVARFGLDPAIAAMERGLWAPPVSLDRRRELLVTMVERILALPPGGRGRPR